MKDTNNFTTGTTFLKWFFSLGKSIVYFVLIAIPSFVIYKHEEAITDFGSFFFGVLFPFFILIGFVWFNIYDWKREERKLYK